MVKTKSGYNAGYGSLSAPPYSLSVRTTAYFTASAQATSARAIALLLQGWGGQYGEYDEGAMWPMVKRWGAIDGGLVTFVVFGHPVQQLALAYLRK